MREWLDSGSPGQGVFYLLYSHKTSLYLPHPSTLPFPLFSSFSSPCFLILLPKFPHAFSSPSFLILLPKFPHSPTPNIPQSLFPSPISSFISQYYSFSSPIFLIYLTIFLIFLSLIYSYLLLLTNIPQL